MKTIHTEDVLDEANKLYKAAKTKKFPRLPPELLPDIESDQVKCILEALVDAINNHTYQFKEED